MTRCCYTEREYAALQRERHGEPFQPARARRLFEELEPGVVERCTCSRAGYRIAARLDHVWAALPDATFDDLKAVCQERVWQTYLREAVAA